MPHLVLSELAKLDSPLEDWLQTVISTNPPAELLHGYLRLDYEMNRQPVSRLQASAACVLGQIDRLGLQLRNEGLGHGATGLC